jgi:hypothetical protein
MTTYLPGLKRSRARQIPAADAYHCPVNRAALVSFGMGRERNNKF